MDFGPVHQETAESMARCLGVALAFIAEEGESHEKKSCSPSELFGRLTLDLINWNHLEQEPSQHSINFQYNFQYNCHNFWCYDDDVFVSMFVSFCCHIFLGGSMVHHVSPRKSRGHPLRRSAQRGGGRWMVSGASFGHREATSKWGNLQLPDRG